MTIKLSAIEALIQLEAVNSKKGNVSEHVTKLAELMYNVSCNFPRDLEACYAIISKSNMNIMPDVRRGISDMEQRAKQAAVGKEEFVNYQNSRIEYWAKNHIYTPDLLLNPVQEKAASPEVHTKKTEIEPMVPVKSEVKAASPKVQTKALEVPKVVVPEKSKEEVAEQQLVGAFKSKGATPEVRLKSLLRNITTVSDDKLKDIFKLDDDLTKKEMKQVRDYFTKDKSLLTSTMHTLDDMTRKVHPGLDNAVDKAINKISHDVSKGISRN